MATLRLTDITLAQSTAITPTTLVHIVTTGDTSQNGAGSSYKAKLSQIYDGLSGYCMPQLLTTFVIPCSPLGISPNDEGDIYFGSTSGLTVDVANSRVGIGTSTPSYKLHVSGSTFIDGALSATGATSTFRNDAPNSVTSEFYIGSSGSVKFFNANNASKYIAINENGIVGANIGNGANSFTIFGASSEVAINAESGAPVYLQNGVQFSTGNVIIGSLVNPGYKLFVSGNTLVTGRTVTENFTMTSGATNGYVLKSDASGNASWQPSSLTTKEVFYKSVSPNSTFGNNATIFDFYLNGGTDPVWVNGIIPSDFSSLISSDLIVLPEFTTTIESYSEIRHSQPGQIFSSSTLFYSAMTSYVEGQNQTIDVSQIFSAVTANDIFSYNFFENHGNNLFVYGLRFKYNAV